MAGTAVESVTQTGDRELVVTDAVDTTEVNDSFPPEILADFLSLSELFRSDRANTPGGKQ